MDGKRMRIQTAGTIFGIVLFAAGGGMLGVAFMGMKLVGLLYGMGIGGFLGGLFGNQWFSGHDNDDGYKGSCQGYHPKAGARRFSPQSP